MDSPAYFKYPSPPHIFTELKYCSVEFLGYVEYNLSIFFVVHRATFRLFRELFQGFLNWEKVWHSSEGGI